MYRNYRGQSTQSPWDSSLSHTHTLTGKQSNANICIQQASSQLKADRHNTYAMHRKKKAGILIKGTEAWVTREKQKAEWDRQGESRGWREMKGYRRTQKRMREYSVKRESVCFSTHEKGRRDPFYKYSGPALDLIWAVMQTSHTSTSTGCCVCVCVSLGGWGIGCQGDSDISGPTPCCPQFSLDKSEKMLSGGPANLQSLSLTFSHSLLLLLIISIFLSLHGVFSISYFCISLYSS